MPLSLLFLIALHAAGSPALLADHAGDAIAWQPFTADRVAAARAVGKPLLISLGTVGCPACRKMAAESFADPELGELINRTFTPLLLDADAEPAAAERLLRAADRLGAPAGFPLNLFLTPELEPYLAVGYLPLDGAPPHRGSWRQVVSGAAEAWRNDPAGVRGEAATLAAELAAELELGAPAPVDEAVRDEAIRRLKALYDDEFAGFGQGAKPLPALELRFLLRESVARNDRVLRRMVLATVDRLTAGGVRDPLGGFFAGSADRAQTIPLLEKKLSDNAQMVILLLDLAAVTGEAKYRGLATETLTAMLRDFGRDDGLLGYRALPDPAEPAPWLSPELPPTAAVLEARRKQLDPRVLAAESGLAISALARAGQQREDPAWRERAAVVGEASWQALNGPDGLRHQPDGGLAGAADLGMFANAMIDLYETTFDRRWLARAGALLDQAETTLADAGSAYAAWPAGPLDEVDRRAIDRGMPSGNAALVRAQLRVARLTEDEARRERASHVLTTHGTAAAAQPVAHLGLLEAQRWLNEDLPAITIIGTAGAARPLLRVAWTGYRPERLIAWLDPAAPDAEQAAEQIPLFESRGPGKKGARAYVCLAEACLRPVDEPAELAEQLAELAAD